MLVVKNRRCQDWYYMLLGYVFFFGCHVGSGLSQLVDVDI